MSNYTNLTTTDSWDVTNIYKSLHLSGRTIAERKKLQKRLDNYCTFFWRQYPAFENFGMFILNDKNGLKLYNGQSFSNEYEVPQYDQGAGTLSGIKFNRRKIEFTVGVYWITEKDYRLLLDYLDPYEINDLVFGYNSQYRYLVKLATMQDSNRLFLGYDTNDEPAFYTELKLSFEIQGAQTALSINNMSLTEESIDTYAGIPDRNRNPLFDTNNTTELYSISYKYNNEQTVSDLDTPFLLDLNVSPVALPASNNFVIEVKLCDLNAAQLDHEISVEPITLFHLNLQFLTAGEQYHIRYDSERGLLYWGDNLLLLTTLSTLTSGHRLVQSETVNMCLLPGKFTLPALENYTNYIIQISLTNLELNQSVSITSFGRTNII